MVTIMFITKCLSQYCCWNTVGRSVNAETWRHDFFSRISSLGASSICASRRLPSAGITTVKLSTPPSGHHTGYVTHLLIHLHRPSQEPEQRWFVSPVAAKPLGGSRTHSILSLRVPISAPQLETTLRWEQPTWKYRKIILTSASLRHCIGSVANRVDGMARPGTRVMPRINRVLALKSNIYRSLVLNTSSVTWPDVCHRGRCFQIQPLFANTYQRLSLVWRHYCKRSGVYFV